MTWQWADHYYIFTINVHQTKCSASLIITHGQPPSTFFVEINHRHQQQPTRKTVKYRKCFLEKKETADKSRRGRQEASHSVKSVRVSLSLWENVHKTIPNGADNKWLRHPLPFYLYQSLHQKKHPFQFQPLICFFSDKACQRMRILEKCTKCNTQNHPFSRITLKIQPRAEQHRPPPTLISCPNRFLQISSLT